MTGLNTESSFAAENPSQLIVQGDKVMYKNFIAPTLETQRNRVNQMNKRHPTPEGGFVRRGVFPAEDSLIEQGWKDIYALTFAYYNDASLQEILTNWIRNDNIIGGFFRAMSSGSDYGVQLKQRLHNLIWETNPQLKERYDGMRLVAEAPKILPKDEAEKWICVSETMSGKFDITVYHLDINGDWIKDNYNLSTEGKTTYKNSLTKANCITLMDSGEDMSDKFSKSQGWDKPAIDLREESLRSLELAKYLTANKGAGKMDLSSLYMTTPPDIYDTEHPEKGIQGAVHEHVKGLLDKLQNPENNK